MGENLRELGSKIGYIDLLLLHEPCDYLAPYPYNATQETAGAYKAMEEAYAWDNNTVRAIGVSNFQQIHLDALFQTNRVKPAVNQCRMSVGNYDKQTHDYCK